MKKSIFFLAIALLGFAQISLAQKPNFGLGIKAGANMNKIDGQSFKDGYNFGYQLGGFAELNFSKTFGLQPEVLWTESSARTGAKFEDIYQDLGAQVKDVKLNYLAIPLLLNIRPSNFITFQVGPQYSILIDKDKRLLDNGKEAFKSGDFSMLGGVQLKLAMFRAYGRYAVGLNDINDIDNRDQWKSQAWQVGLGYVF